MGFKIKNVRTKIQYIHFLIKIKLFVSKKIDDAICKLWFYIIYMINCEWYTIILFFTIIIVIDYLCFKGTTIESFKYNV